MGRSCSWVGIRAQTERALTKLQLKQTGEFSDVLEAPLCGVRLETGWYVVVANRDFRFVEPARLEDLSFDCEVVGGLVEEHSMVSQAVAWRDGVLQWDVAHEGRVNRTHLQVEGAPPHEMFSLAEEARANKKPFVDHMFEVPPGLLHAWTGFRLEDSHRFETLVATEQPWRAFQHPDGRLWAIRPGGAGYQLRIGAPDDPVLKERSSLRALRDVEALIAEQVADGFVPQG